MGRALVLVILADAPVAICRLDARDQGEDPDSVSQPFEIADVLRAPDRALVRDEGVSADEVDFEIAEGAANARRPRVRETEARQLGENIDSYWSHTHLKDGARLREVVLIGRQPL